MDKIKIHKTNSKPVVEVVDDELQVITMRKIRVRKGSIAYYAKEFIQLLGILMVIIGFLIVFSAAAADDLKEYEMAYATAETDKYINKDAKVAETSGQKPEMTSEWTSLGEFEITAYCSCEKCCGKADGITASGTKAEVGKTIAVDTDVIPYGTEVTIDGHTYIAQDCGGAIKGNRIDVYYGSHEEALAHGIRYAEVMVKAGDK